jgi:putative transposase
LDHHRLPPPAPRRKSRAEQYWLLGLWLGETEGAKFWLSCLTDLKNRGVSDLLIACVDGLTGFPEAIRTAYPQAKVQLCLVHLVRAALKYMTDSDSRKVAADLKAVYTSATVLEAEQALDKFAEVWGTSTRRLCGRGG